MKLSNLPLLALSLALLTGCATQGVQRNVETAVAVNKSVTEVPESQLLDVWVEVLEPGKLPEKEKQAAGLSMDIRKAEARYIAEELRATMEGTGYWGAVRMVPRGMEGGELVVAGTILQSDGARLALNIVASDASGRRWFNSNYKAEVSPSVYQLGSQRGDAFQALYNTIANDLANFLSTLTADDIIEIRRVAELRFASDLAPDAFNAYLQRDEEGSYKVVHLPSVEDPMYKRVQSIRERDLLMIDTLNGHYDNFYREMEFPYTEWRKSRSEEAAALRKLEKEANKRTWLGIAAIAGAILIGATSDGYNAGTDVLTDAMVLGGAYAIKSGMDKRSQTVIHRDAIEELGQSFSSETQPLVVEVEGKTLELTGSAETQYGQWRELLRQVYAAETGLPDAPDEGDHDTG